ncbi:MAG: 16S rRNA (cytosine(1402)-N(4))-methyltransferase RsmH [Bacteroidota bacterium]|nr:16S rRNA (cytosine(1402)-N(4))-methyltransferase RsmH [Bacteroidota bacterium]
MSYHVPVLLTKAVDALNVKPDGKYADLTFGGGGHSQLILSQLKKGTLMVFDQDEDALKNIPDAKNIIAVHANFRYIKQFMRYYQIDLFDGIIADLGVSSWQIDEKERGFSFRFDAELDMRMNPDDVIKAKDVIDNYDEGNLIRIFRNYGELKNAGQIAQRIVKARKIGHIKTTGDLKELLSPLVAQHIEHKFFARVFQALRIEVNQEMEALKEFLAMVPDVLKPGGRLVVLSYHSLEDRLVKNFIRAGNPDGKIEKDFFGNFINPVKAITKKPVQADEKETDENPRARSVKMRIAEMKKHE